MKQPAVYIVAGKRNGTLYIGVTSNLAKRAWEHRIGAAEGFAKKYGCSMLVWYELQDTMDVAITREKQMKEWKRSWKLREIEALNPDWNDLFLTLA